MYQPQPVLQALNCDGTRAPLANWSARLSLVRP